MMMNHPVLELNEVTVQLNGKPVLDRLSLKIRRNEHTAIIGPNGSGKSTLIKLLTHKVYPFLRKSGTPPIRVFGKEQWNVEKLHLRLGIVSADLQNRFLTSTAGGRITGLEVVLTGHFSSLRLFPHQTVTPEMHRQARQLLDEMGVAHLAEKRLNEVSEGEARRVLIARALVTSPEVLVLDEPTTALDVVARRDFMERIRERVRNGTTLILVTHHIDEVIPEIGRVILLKEGEALFDGPKEEVLTSENLSEVFGRKIILNRKNGSYSALVE